MVRGGSAAGDRVRHFIHRLARDPDAHDRRAKETFARYGPPILVIAKFVPGLDAVTPPLAGTSRTSRLRFLTFDAVGAGLYSCAYAALGYVFSHDLERAAAYAGRAGTVLAGLALAGLLYVHRPQVSLNARISACADHTIRAEGIWRNCRQSLKERWRNSIMITNAVAKRHAVPDAETTQHPVRMWSSAVLRNGRSTV